MTLLRLALVGASAYAMWAFLPILDIVEIVFILMIGVAWLFLVVDFLMVSVGMITDLSMGISEKVRVGVEASRAKVRDMREDLADRVEEKLAATA